MENSPFSSLVFQKMGFVSCGRGQQISSVCRPSATHVEPVLDPAALLDVVQVDEASRVGVAVRRREDAPSAQLQRRLLGQVVVVLCVQHAVRKRLPGPHAE